MNCQSKTFHPLFLCKAIRGKTMTDIEIYFDDLSEAKQKELLEAVGVKTAEDMNWDVIPITTVELNGDTNG